MDLSTILVGLLLGFSAAIVWPDASATQRFPAGIRIIVGGIGGLIGAWLSGEFGSGDPVAAAIWAWATAILVGYALGLLRPSN